MAIAVVRLYMSDLVTAAAEPLEGYVERSGRLVLVIALSM